MARINIEECWWSDPRRSKLIKLLGDEDKADAQALRMWRVAQEFWVRGKALVPHKVWATLEANSKLIEANLAEEREAGIYVFGSSEHFDWVLERREAGRLGGVKSAEVRRKRHGSAQPKPKQTRSKPEANPSKRKPLTLSLSLTPTLEDSFPTEMAISAKSPTPVGVYVTAYQEKYGFRPEIGPREGKILKTFAGNHPDRWEELIRGYLQMPDSWAVARSHPVEVLPGKVNEIGRFLATGKVVTKKVLQSAEEMIDKAQGTDRRPRRSLEEIEKERREMLFAASQKPQIGGDS